MRVPLRLCANRFVLATGFAKPLTDHSFIPYTQYCKVAVVQPTYSCLKQVASKKKNATAEADTSSKHIL